MFSNKLFTFVSLAACIVLASGLSLQSTSLVERANEKCPKTLYRKMWNDPALTPRPKDVNAAACYDGGYDYDEPLHGEPVLVDEGYHSCDDNSIKKYHCFFLRGSYSLQFYDDTSDDHLAVWYNHDVCTTQDATLTCSVTDEQISGSM